VSYTYDSVGNRHTMTDTRNEGDDPATNMTQKGFMYNLNNCLIYTCQTYADGKIKLDWFTYDANGNQTSRTSELWSKDKMVSIDPKPTKDLRGGDSEPTPTPDPNARTETPTPEPGRGDPTPEPTETPDPDAPELLSSLTESYSYNEVGLLVGINADYYDAEYTYNPDGLRHSKTVNNEKRVHIWDGMSIIGESVDNGSPTWYVRGNNLLWSKDSAGTTSYLYNGHNDVVATTGANAQDYLYDAFGNQVDGTTNQPFEWRVDVAPTVTDGNPFRYCGEYFDYETGYIYLRARMYDSANGRFISEDTHWNPDNMIYGDDPVKINEREKDDPLGLRQYMYVPSMLAIMQSGNLYAFCAGNPVRYKDVNGNFLEEVLPGLFDILISLLTAAFSGVVAYKVTKSSISRSHYESFSIDWEKVLKGMLGMFSITSTGMLVGAFEIAKIDEQHKTHILYDDHNWNKLVPDPKDPNNWDKIVAIIMTVLNNGTVESYRGDGALISTYTIGETIVQVTFKIVDGIIRISDAWVVE